MNQTTEEGIFSNLYPSKCTRKEGREEPTQAQVDSLVQTILPKADFFLLQADQSFWRIRTSSKEVTSIIHEENGDDLFDAI
jgi:hypothetical protein